MFAPLHEKYSGDLKSGGSGCKSLLVRHREYNSPIIRVILETLREHFKPHFTSTAGAL